MDRTQNNKEVGVTSLEHMTMLNTRHQRGSPQSNNAASVPTATEEKVVLATQSVVPLTEEFPCRLQINKQSDISNQGVLSTPTDWSEFPAWINIPMANTTQNMWAWLHYLRYYPDRKFAHWLAQQLQFGADILHNNSDLHRSHAPRMLEQHENKLDAVEDDALVTAFITEGLELQHIQGPFPVTDFPYQSQQFIISPLQKVVKEGKKPRIVLNCSYPYNEHSVNANISDTKCKLQTVIQVMNKLRYLKRMFPVMYPKFYFFKMDIKAAYKQIRVHKEDIPRLGFRWKDQVYFFQVLPFGMKSSTIIFESFSSFAEWIAKNHHWNIPHLHHYIDDFLGIAASAEASIKQAEQLEKLLTLLGLQVETKKTEAGVTVIIYLGIELDGEKMEARLPQAKLQAIKDMIQEWLQKDRANLKQLQSLVGHLNFASVVVQASRPFIGRLYRAIKHHLRVAEAKQNPFIPLKISAEMRKDLKWWSTFIEDWNGIHLMYDDQWDADFITIYSDASGKGYGAVVGQEWFQGRWTDEELAEAQRQKALSMVYLEFKVLVLAASTFGHQWQRKSIEFRTDNESTVKLNEAQYTSDPHLLGLLRTLCFLAYQHNFRFRVRHIPGSENEIADRLSRFAFQPFEKSPTGCSPRPTPIVPLPQHDW
jgi:hypothetical protein